MQVNDLYLAGQVDPSLTFNERPAGEAGRVACIVLHHTGSVNEAGDIGWLNGGSARWSLEEYRDMRGAVSTHKVFKRDGTIVKIVPEGKRAWHAGPSLHLGREDLNDFSIGYEICNRGNGEAYPEAQVESVAQSIAYDCALYRIPDVWVVTHRLIRDQWLAAHPGTADRKTDPLGFDLGRLMRRVWEIRGAWPYGTAPRLWACGA